MWITITKQQTTQVKQHPDMIESILGDRVNINDKLLLWNDEHDSVRKV